MRPLTSPRRLPPEDLLASDGEAATAVSDLLAQDRLSEALRLAFAHLERRDRTVVEISAHLRGRGVDDGVISQAVVELQRQGCLDDRRFALTFAEDRRTLDGWGAERIEARLRKLGIEQALVEEAVATREPADELAAAVELLRRRFPVAPSEDRDRARALALLVRKGYDLDLAYDAVRAYERDDTG